MKEREKSKMKTGTEQQIRNFVQKEKNLINEAQDEKERDYIAVMWLGFLNGLRLTNAITYQEYKELFDEIQQYIAGFEAA